MYKNFSKIIFACLALLVAFGAQALPPDKEPERVSKKIGESERTNAQGHVIPTSDHYETRMPWNSKIRVFFSSDGLPEPLTDLSKRNDILPKYDMIVRPASFDFGPLEYYNVSNLLPLYNVNTEYPQSRLLKKMGETYDDRYHRLEILLEGKLYENLPRKFDQKIRVAIASFKNPVYYDSRGAVAFYTFAAIYQALQPAIRENADLKNLEITILSNHDPVLEKLFKAEHRKRIQIREAIDSGKYSSVEKIPNLHPIFSIDSKVDSVAEMEYFLDFLDRVAKNNGFTDVDNKPISAHEAFRAILAGNEIGTNNRGSIPTKVAPDHVMRQIRSMVQIMYRNGSFNHEILRLHIKATIKRKSSTGTVPELEVEKLMNEIKTIEESNFLKLRIYAEILKTTEVDRIRKVIDRFIKK